MPSVFVDGVPQAQGNLRRSPHGGIYEAGKATRPWKSAIAYEVALVVGDQGATREPVALVARFQFVRPLSHSRKSGALAKGAPRAMTRNPDVDKLCRAVLDALTGVLYVDDCQVVQLVAFKSYGDRAGLDLTWNVDEPDAESV